MNALIARAWIALIGRTSKWTQAGRTRLGNLLGNLLWWLVLPRRRVTLANLEACFPDLSRAQRDDLCRRHHEALAIGFFESFLCWGGSVDRLRRLSRVVGIETSTRGSPAGVGC